MSSRSKKSGDEFPPSRPATSPEARQAQLENLALNLIEQRLRDGSASSQETTMFAKSASTRGKIEEVRIQHDIELMKAKKTQIESQAELQEMFKEAIHAMNTYRIEGEEDADIPGTF